jgi:hypothetical protein
MLDVFPLSPSNVIPVYQQYDWKNAEDARVVK